MGDTIKDMREKVRDIMSMQDDISHQFKAVDKLLMGGTGGDFTFEPIEPRVSKREQQRLKEEEEARIAAEEEARRIAEEEARAAEEERLRLEEEERIRKEEEERIAAEEERIRLEEEERIRAEKESVPKKKNLHELQLRKKLSELKRKN